MAKKKTKGNWIILVIILILLILAGILIWRWSPSMTGKMSSNNTYGPFKFKVNSPYPMFIEINSVNYSITTLWVNSDKKTAKFGINGEEATISRGQTITLGGLEMYVQKIYYTKKTTSRYVIVKEVKKVEEPKGAEKVAEVVPRNQFKYDGEVVIKKDSRGNLIGGPVVRMYRGTNWECFQEENDKDFSYTSYTITNNAELVGSCANECNVPKTKGAVCVFTPNHSWTKSPEFVLSTSSTVINSGVKPYVDKSVEIEMDIKYQYGDSPVKQLDNSRIQIDNPYSIR